MSEFRAGFGRREITPRLGCQLVGYDRRAQGALGVHDPLWARALVLEHAGERWALVACDLCFVSMSSVQAIRQAVFDQAAILPAHVFVAATHTHAGPDDTETSNWEQPLADLIAQAVVQACDVLQPARIGSGLGFLYGYSINRRWLDRPVDPAVAVIRIDDGAGKPLGLVSTFACHAVVLGPDNHFISADWPGRACQAQEAALGPGTTCLFLQGGAGDINPVVAGVRARLQSGHTVLSIGNLGAYYGSPDDPERWNIGSRQGGTFAEASELGEAFSAEVLRIAQGIRTQPATLLWSQQVLVDAARSPDEPQPETPRPFDALDLAAITDPTGRIPAEIMLLGVDDLLLLGEPGEVFSETAVRFRTLLRLLGYATPMLVGYANGRLDYLPEPEAFAEGGYEPSYPNHLGISRQFQTRVWRAIEPIVRQHRLPSALSSSTK